MRMFFRSFFQAISSMFRLLAYWMSALSLLMPLSASAIGVTPAILDLSASAGQYVEGRVLVHNTDDRSRTYFLSTQGFGVRDNSGVADFSQGNNVGGMDGWIQFSSPTIQLARGESRDVAFTVSVPVDADAGAYQRAIVVSDQPVGQEGSATVSSRVASLVFFTVEGDVRHGIALEDVAVSHRCGVWCADTHVAVRVHNTGTVHEHPDISVATYSLLGTPIATTTLTGSTTRLVPGQSRTFEGDLSFSASSFVADAATQLTSGAFGPVSTVVEVRANGTEVARYSTWRFLVPGSLLVGLSLMAVLAVGVGHVVRRRRRS